MSTLLSILSGYVVNIQHQHLVRVKSIPVESLTRYSWGGHGRGGKARARVRTHGAAATAAAAGLAPGDAGGAGDGDDGAGDGASETKKRKRRGAEQLGQARRRREAARREAPTSDAHGAG